MPSPKKSKLVKALPKKLSLTFPNIERLLKDFEQLSSFDKKVLIETAKIPFGQTRSYKWLAEKIGNPKAYRAVAQALRKNPLPFIIPCHRVIKSNGSIGGYSKGEEMKKYLIYLEKMIKSVIINL